MRRAGLAVVLAGAVLGVTLSLVLMLPGPAAPAGAGALLFLLVFLLWPWTVLPVGILGGALAGAFLGGGDIRVYVAAHLLLLATGGVALAVRHGLRLDTRPRRTPAHTGMLCVVGLTVVGAGYGLAIGNLPTQVLVAAYQIAILPVYFFLAIHTLTTRRRLVAAGLLYLAAVVGLTAVSMAVPGRHGGLLALLAAPMLMWVAGRTRGLRRATAVVLAAFLCADVLLASYRGIWLAAGVTFLVMLVLGRRSVRLGMAATAAAGILVAGLLALHPGVRERAQEIGDGLRQSAGYRGPESIVGLGVFAERPLLGAGLGQSTTDIYLADFASTDVGPVYHAFYVTLLANVGLVGLGLVLWPILRSIRAGLASRDGPGVPFAALCCGFLVAAMFAAPTDGHWELGLLPALTLLTSPWRATGARRPAPARAAWRPREVVWR
ncbi:O-antigen ligase family protein [Micromonospora sp. NPDC047074]|uniref:O-antigen ligase family protein n=1 Tax=Micromonospora sp. NPDC047074 TaxID=3154339 RepID=UPI003409EE22